MPLLQCWPKSCTASPRQGAAATRWESCLGLDLSIDMWLPHRRSPVCTPLAERRTLLLATASRG